MGMRSCSYQVCYNATGVNTVHCIGSPEAPSVPGKHDVAEAAIVGINDELTPTPLAGFCDFLVRTANFNDNKIL
jgi:hypothetical protein